MQNFKRKEFECQCGCGFNTVDYKLAIILDDVRNHFNKPTHISSGCRCTQHNKSIGGAKNSQHRFGKAADIVVKDTKPLDVYKYIDSKYPDELGLGLYKSWIHVDVRIIKARWNKTNLMKGGN